MLHDDTFHDEIEAAIGAAETQTSAEIVLAMAKESGSYRDTELLAGGGLAALALIGILFAPFSVSEYLVVPYAAAFMAVGSILASKLLPLRRLLCRKPRRRQQVETASHVAFFEEGVSATQERNGVLVYYSAFENQLRIVADLGIEGRVAAAEFNELVFAFNNSSESDRRGALIAVIKSLGETLAKAFPPGDDNPDEIPNRPRIR